AARGAGAAGGAAARRHHSQDLERQDPAARLPRGAARRQVGRAGSERPRRSRGRGCDGPGEPAGRHRRVMTPPVPEPPATPAPLRERLADLDGAAVIAWLEAYLLDRVAAVMELSASRLDPARPLGALGLDSLYAVQLAHEVETGLGVELSIATLLDGPSVSELAAELAGKLVGVAEPPPLPVSPASPGPPAPPASPTPLSASASAAVVASPAPGGLGAAGDEEVPLTLGQRALYFLDRLAPRGAAYVIAGAAGVRGDLDLAALRQACAALVERHPALRTTF